MVCKDFRNNSDDIEAIQLTARQIEIILIKRTIELINQMDCGCNNYDGHCCSHYITKKLKERFQLED